MLGVNLWSLQAAVLQPVADNKRTTVQAGHGFAMAFLTAVLVLWFVMSRRTGQALVITTARLTSRSRRSCGAS